jgi:hypothetical protein
VSTTTVCPYCQFRVGHAVYCLYFVAQESTPSHLDEPTRPSDTKASIRDCLDESVTLLARSVELLTRYVGLLAEAEKEAQGFASPQPAKNCEKQTDYETMAFAGVKRGSVTKDEVKEAVLLAKAFMDRGWDGDTAMLGVLKDFAKSRGIL